jgi:hypothetical protein
MQDIYDNNYHLNNYEIIKNEEFRDFDKFIYIKINIDYDKSERLNKMLSILNQNSKLIHSIIYYKHNKYFKIDISKYYDHRSFEYEFIRDSLIFTCNFRKTKDFNELLYLDLNSDDDNYVKNFRLLIDFNPKNKYLKNEYLKDFYFKNRLNVINYELTYMHKTKLRSELNYTYVQKRNLKRKKTNYDDSEDKPKFKKHIIEFYQSGEKAQAADVHKKAQAADVHQKAQAADVHQKAQAADVHQKAQAAIVSPSGESKSSNFDDHEYSYISKMILLSNDKKYTFDTIDEFKNTISILDKLNIKYVVQICENDTYESISKTIIDILLN